MRAQLAEAEAQVERIRKTGGRALAEQADVSDPAAVGACSTRRKNCGGVDMLVNNAGIMRLATLVEVDDARSTVRSRST